MARPQPGWTMLCESVDFIEAVHRCAVEATSLFLITSTVTTGPSSSAGPRARRPAGCLSARA